MSKLLAYPLDVPTRKKASFDLFSGNTGAGNAWFTATDSGVGFDFFC